MTTLIRLCSTPMSFRFILPIPSYSYNILLLKFEPVGFEPFGFASLPLIPHLDPTKSLLHFTLGDRFLLSSCFVSLSLCLPPIPLLYTIVSAAFSVLKFLIVCLLLALSTLNSFSCPSVLMYPVQLLNSS